MNILSEAWFSSMLAPWIIQTHAPKEPMGTPLLAQRVLHSPTQSRSAVVANALRNSVASLLAQTQTQSPLGVKRLAALSFWPLYNHCQPQLVLVVNAIISNAARRHALTQILNKKMLSRTHVQMAWRQDCQCLVADAKEENAQTQCAVRRLAKIQIWTSLGHKNSLALSLWRR
jgi:hypothetical protein